MHCPFCGEDDTRVIDSRASRDGFERTRKRICPKCGRNFTTNEQVAASHLQVRKRDGRIEPFSRAKLAKGIMKAASIYEVTADEINAFVDRVVRGVQPYQPGIPVRSEDIGYQVLQELYGSRHATDVARIRYAIVFLGRTTSSTGGFRGLRDFLAWLEEAYGPPRIAEPASTPWVVRKRNGTLQPFDQEKLARSIGIAAKGRGTDETVRRHAKRVAHEAAEELHGQALVTSGQIAGSVLKLLRVSDALTYLRYASAVKGYRSVDDVWTDALGLDEH